MATDCIGFNDYVGVSWNKDGGKPLYLAISPAGSLVELSYLKIPGSRGSKGNWTFIADIDLQPGTTYWLRLDARTGFDVEPLVCQ